MNDTSTTARSKGASGIGPSTERMLVLSSTVTRGSVRSDHASCPYPTSSAVTARAPRCSTQSVNPPVDAPTSRTRIPAGSKPNVSSAAASLCPPRETYCWLAVTSKTVPFSTCCPALLTGSPPTFTSPARIAACARALDGNRPASTSAASARMRAIARALLLPDLGQSADDRVAHGGRREPDVGEQLVGGTVSDEAVRDTQVHDRRGERQVGRRLEHRRAEAAEPGVLLEGDHQVVTLRRPRDRLEVQRLDPSHVRDGRGYASLRQQHRGRLLRRGHPPDRE